MTGQPLRGFGVIPPARLVRSRHRLDHTAVLIVGGTAEMRLQVAFAFHRESRLRSGPLVCIDCAREERELRGALEDWWSAPMPETAANPLRAAAHGTLFLDCIGALSTDTQRMLLDFVRRGADDPWGIEGVWRGRLAAGSPDSPWARASRGEFADGLLDALDKVRVLLPDTDLRGVA